MKQILATAALRGALGLAACQREPEPAPAPAAEPAADAAVAAESATVPGTDAIAAVENTPPSTSEAAKAFDARAFAGTFAGTDGTLTLAADGTYVFDTGSAKTDGTWTTEEKDTRVRLDPNSKAEDDRVYEIAGNDELRLLGADGKATGATLKRG